MSNLFRHSSSVLRHSPFLILGSCFLLLTGCTEYHKLTSPYVPPYSEVPDTHPTINDPPQAYVRYAPERDDDIAWENDRTAFRIFGPELETAAPPFSSGIDVWSKKGRNPVINTWYQQGEHSYHIDHGTGMDCYKVGAGRGCGGIAVYNPDDHKYYVSHDWQSFSIINRGPKEAVFQVTYAPWRVTTPAQKVENPGDPGRKVWQVTKISLPMGSNLNRIETTLYSNEPGPLTVAIGLATHNVKDGMLWKQGTRMTFWDKADHIPEDKNDNGYNGVALIANPADFQHFDQTPDDNLAIITATPGKPFVYYTGACWSNGPDFHSDTQWNHYIETFKTDF